MPAYNHNQNKYTFNGRHAKHYAIDAETRKYHYWRGVRATLTITIPIIAILCIVAQTLINHCVQ